MPTYFSLQKQQARDFARTEPRWLEFYDSFPGDDAKPVEWRLLNEVNHEWLTLALTAALRRTAEDEAWLARAVRFADYLRCRLDGGDDTEFQYDYFDEPPAPF